MKRFFKNIGRNWKTSAAGAVLIAGLFLPVPGMPPATLDQKILGTVTGVGLILGKDGDQTGTADKNPQ